MPLKSTIEIIPIFLGGVYSYLLKGRESILIDSGNPGSDKIILKNFLSLELGTMNLS